MKKSIWLISSIFYFLESAASANPSPALVPDFWAFQHGHGYNGVQTPREIMPSGAGNRQVVSYGDDELKALWPAEVQGNGRRGRQSNRRDSFRGISVAVNEWACKNKVLYTAFCHTSIPLGKEPCKVLFRHDSHDRGRHAGTPSITSARAGRLSPRLPSAMTNWPLDGNKKDGR
jgi:hypothetical protein